MKLLVVLSQVNYMPENYNGLLAGLVESISSENLPVKIAGCVSLKTLDTSLLKSIVKMPLVGVTNLPLQLSKNIISTLKKEREKVCAKYSIAHHHWETMNSKSAIEWIKDQEIDLILNLRTRCIYKPEVLDAPKLGCVNIHHGLLPQYRGTFCDLYALFENRPAGFSIHQMAKKVDAGSIYQVTIVNEGREKNYQKYLTSTIPKEIDSLTQFLKNCITHQEYRLPTGEENTIEKPTYTKNPDAKMIRKLKQKGMIL